MDRYIGEKSPTENLKNHLWRNSCAVKVFERFKCFTGTFKRFCGNIPERLQREVHLSVTLVWNLRLFFLSRNTTNNKFLDVANKEIKKVTWHRCWSLKVWKWVWFCPFRKILYYVLWTSYECSAVVLKREDFKDKYHIKSTANLIPRKVKIIMFKILQKIPKDM